MALFSKGNNKLSSTNIAEILEAQIEAIKNVNDVIVKSKIDEAMLKNVVDSVKPISDTIKALNDISQQMGGLKISNVVANVSFKIGVKGLVSSIKIIADELGNLTIDKKASEKVKAVCDSIKSISEISTDLMKLGLTSILLAVLKPLIIKTIKMIAEISKELSEMEDSEGIEAAIAMGNMLSALGKGLLLFVAITLGGIVPLIATVSLLAVKAFVWLFLKLFSSKTETQLIIASVTLDTLAKTLLVLSMTILLWALMGVLIIESWKEIGITILFVIFAILVFTFLGYMISLIEPGQTTIKQIAATLLLLSMTVLLWALMGDLIVEEWASIAITILFIIAAIGVFTLLGLAIKVIDEGNKSIVKMALTLMFLSLTILLWALMGELVVEEWWHIGIVAIFVGLAIGLMLVLGIAGKTIQDGSKNILLLTAALAVLSLDIFIMAMAGKVLQDNWLAILCVGAFIVVLIAICVGLTFAAPYIQPGVMLLQSLAIAILIVSAAFLVFGLAMKLFDKETIANMVYLFAGLTASMAMMGIMSPLVALGAAALIILGAALLVFSPALLLYSIALASLKSTNVDEESVTLPIKAAKWIVDAINDAFGIKGMVAVGLAIMKMMSLIPIAIAVGTIAKIIQQIASLNIPTAFDSNGNATAFQKMTADDFTEAATNAASMASILANLFGEKEFTTKIKGKDVTITPITEDDLKKITAKTVIKMKLLNVVVSSIGIMAETLKNLASLIIPDESKGFSKEGKPNGWRKMDDNDFTMATNNVAKIITTLLEAIGSDDITKLLESLSNKAIKNIGLVLSNTSGVSDLVNAIEKTANFDNTAIEVGVGRIKAAISGYAISLQELFVGAGKFIEKNGIFGKKYYKFEITGAPELDNSKLRQINRSLNDLTNTLELTSPIIDNIKELADKSKDANPQVIADIISNYIDALYGKNGIKIGGDVPAQNGQLRFIINQQERLANINTEKLQKNTESFVKFIDKANTVDTEKLKSVRDMFEQMAEFSKSIHGDFDKLADVLSDKLVDILQKLHVTLEDIANTESTTTNTTVNNETTQQTTQKAEVKENKQEITQKQEKNLKDIKNALEEITSALREIKDNTENYSRY